MAREWSRHEIIASEPRIRMRFQTRAITPDVSLNRLAYGTEVNVLLTRAQDIAEMNRLYEAVFAPAPFPARTTAVVAALPDPATAASLRV